MNDRRVLDLLSPREGSLMQRLLPISDSQELAEILYMQVLSRPPTNDECAELRALLAAQAERRETILRHYVWGMLTSLEFCVNH
jgi:hypothetical protein